jgi:DNA-binding response OmpR family regulator
MLNKMGKETRKISAGVQGNISALAGNIHSWSADLVEDFLRNINHDIGALNEHLDQILKFIKLFDRIPIYPDSVNVGELIKKIINSNENIKKRIIQPEDYFADFPSVQLDPDLTRLIFEYALMVIIRVSTMADMIEIFAEDRGDTIKLTIGKSNNFIDSEEMELTNDTPQLYLIRQLITAQSGEFAVWGSKTSPKSGLRFEMIFPTSQSQADPREETSKSPSKDITTGRILVAESQPEYQTLLLQELEEQGYRVDLAIEGSAVLDLVQRINPDLVVIDRNLDGLDGILVTQGIRRWSDVPIIMVSSRTNPDDLLHAFQTGIDDYLTKPFLLDEILVRIDANIRRGRNSSQAFTPDIFVSGDVRINSSTRQVWLRGELVELTPIEYNLLFYMAQHRKQIMPYEQIVERAWEGPEKGSRQGLFVHIRRLREKIEQNPKEPKIIQNKWGVGYIFSPSE